MFQQRRALGLLPILVGVLACSGSGSSSPSAPTTPTAPTLCSFSLVPGPFPIGAAGGRVTVPLTTQPGCTWNSDALDFLTHPGADSTGSGSRSFEVDVPANVGGRRQGQFRIQGFVGPPYTNTFVSIVTQNATIDQDPQAVQLPTAPSYFYYAAPYPSFGGVTRVARDGVDASLALGAFEQTINVVVYPLGQQNMSQAGLTIAAPIGQTLQPGTYENAMATPSVSNPRLDFDAGGQTCSTVSGRFTVQDVLIGGPAPAGGGNSVSRLRVSFEVSCGSPTLPPVVGEVWYVAP
jgi:hypothetical protein